MSKKLSNKRIRALMERGVIYEPKPNVLKSLDQHNLVVETEGDVKKVIKNQLKHQKSIKKIENELKRMGVRSWVNTQMISQNN